MSVIFDRLTVANCSSLDSGQGPGVGGYSFQTGVLDAPIAGKGERHCQGGEQNRKRLSRLILGLLAFSRTENKMAV